MIQELSRWARMLPSRDVFPGPRPWLATSIRPLNRASVEAALNILVKLSVREPHSCYSGQPVIKTACRRLTKMTMPVLAGRHC